MAASPNVEGPDHEGSRLRPQPKFATPLPQSPRSDILEWRFPAPHRHLVLTGRSRAAWHTSFVIPQLNLLLDAGLCVNKLRPRHIFLTHGHSDHTLLTPAFIDRDDPPDLFCPAEMVAVLDAFVNAKTLLSAGGLIGPDDERNGDGGADTETDDGGGVAQKKFGKGKRPRGRRLLDTHVTHGVRPGDVVTLPRAPSFTATAFACDHTVPCVGYVFSQISRPLRPEYTGLPVEEIKALRTRGIEVSAPRSTPIFAFLGDTTAATLAAAPEWLSGGIPVVITECSFIREDHRPQAEKTKHTIWGDLEPVVRRWPSTTFVLTHFSLRYTEVEIRRFFAEMDDPPANIVVWADGEPEEEER